MLILAVPIVLWTLVDRRLLIVGVYGQQYAASVYPFRVLIFALLFIFLDFPLGALLNADDRQKTKTFIMGGTMSINVLPTLY